MTTGPFKDRIVRILNSIRKNRGCAKFWVLSNIVSLSCLIILSIVSFVFEFSVLDLKLLEIILLWNMLVAFFGMYVLAFRADRLEDKLSAEVRLMHNLLALLDIDTQGCTAAARNIVAVRVNLLKEEVEACAISAMNVIFETLDVGGLVYSYKSTKCVFGVRWESGTPHPFARTSSSDGLVSEIKLIITPGDCTLSEGLVVEPMFRLSNVVAEVVAQVLAEGRKSLAGQFARMQGC